MDQETDPGLWVALNSNFHGVFSEVDRGSRLAAILDGLRDSASAYVAVSINAAEKRREANSQHKQLLRFYRVRDEDAAVKLTLEHLQSTLTAIENRPVSGVL